MYTPKGYRGFKSLLLRHKKVPDFPLKTENQELFCYLCDSPVFPDSCVMFLPSSLENRVSLCKKYSNFLEVFYNGSMILILNRKLKFGTNWSFLWKNMGTYSETRDIRLDVNNAQVVSAMIRCISSKRRNIPQPLFANPWVTHKSTSCKKSSLDKFNLNYSRHPIQWAEANCPNIICSKSS